MGDYFELRISDRKIHDLSVDMLKNFDKAIKEMLRRGVLRKVWQSYDVKEGETVIRFFPTSGQTSQDEILALLRSGNER